jgi:hypothetical protein
MDGRRRAGVGGQNCDGALLTARPLSGHAHPVRRQQAPPQARADRSVPRHSRQLRCGSDHGPGWHAGDPHIQIRTSGGTRRSSQLRWFLAAVDVEWHRAQRGEVRDFVLWLGMCHNPARDRHRPDAPAQGAVNSRTGKTSLRAGYAPATINHAVSVMSAFYDFHLLSGQGPVVSPVPPQSRDGRRLQGHHNPLEPFRLHRSLIPGPQI